MLSDHFTRYKMGGRKEGRKITRHGPAQERRAQGVTKYTGTTLYTIAPGLLYVFQAELTDR
jgi:hypothetical protein